MYVAAPRLLKQAYTPWNECDAFVHYRTKLPVTRAPVWLFLCYSTFVLQIKIDSCLIPKRGLVFSRGNAGCAGLIKLVPKDTYGTPAPLCSTNPAIATVVTFLLDKLVIETAICQLEAIGCSSRGVPLFLFRSGNRTFLIFLSLQCALLTLYSRNKSSVRKTTTVSNKRTC